MKLPLARLQELEDGVERTDPATTMAKPLPKPPLSAGKKKRRESEMRQHLHQEVWTKREMPDFLEIHRQ